MTPPKVIQGLVAQAKGLSIEERNRTRPPSITDLLTSELVTISVGDPVSKVYHVHRALLCARDPVFEAGHRPKCLFTKGHSEKVNYPDQLPEVMNLFVRWLYNDSDYLSTTSIDGVSLRVIGERSLPAHVHLYTFADFRCIEVLQSQALKEIIRFYRQGKFFVLEPTLCLVYESTPRKCTLRQFMSRAWFFHQLQRRASGTGAVTELASRDTEFGEDFAAAAAGYASRVWNEPDDGF